MTESDNVDHILHKLKSLKFFYKKKTNKKFVYLEEFQQDVITKKNRYIIKIENHHAGKQLKNFDDESLQKINESVWVKKRTNYVTEINVKSVQVVLTGDQISERYDRLFNMLKLYFIQPPGRTFNGNLHNVMQLSSFELELDEVKHEFICNYKPKNLQNARYLNSKLVSKDVMALQKILHYLGYDEELEWDRYDANGVFGDNTKKAVESFVADVNKINRRDKPSLVLGKNCKITRLIANELLKKCKEGWQRPQPLIHSR